MNKYKIGDKIVILDRTWNILTSITIGNVYEIIAIDKTIIAHQIVRYVILDNNDNKYSMYESQFMSIDEYRKSILEEILN